MTTEPRPDRTRLWILLCRAWLVLMVVLAAAVRFLPVEPTVSVPAFFAIVVAMWVPLLPRWSWWGPGPAALKADPARRKEMRSRELDVFLIAGFIVVVIVPAVVAMIRP